MVQNLEFGLKLVMERTGQSEFVITSEAFIDPDTFIRKLIQRSYEKKEECGKVYCQKFACQGIKKQKGLPDRKQVSLF
jgi:hypothetical protein